MAIDLRAVDKKKVGIIALAVGAGLVAVVLTNNYIEKSSRERAQALAGGMSDAEKAGLLQRIEGLERASQELITRQNYLAQAAQQQQAAGQQPAPKPQLQLSVKTPVGKRAI